MMINLEDRTEVGVTWLALFTTTGTLVCCALPITLVSLGLGATVASLVSTVPFLVTLSYHKGVGVFDLRRVTGDSWVVDVPTGTGLSGRPGPGAGMQPRPVVEPSHLLDFGSAMVVGLRCSVSGIANCVVVRGVVGTMRTMPGSQFGGQHKRMTWSIFIVAVSAPTLVQAHDPVFGVGPHVLFKQGIEFHLGTHQEKAGGQRETEAEIQLKYGLGADWVVGIAIPYHRESGDSARGPTSLSTKYRFWRQDMPGAQESAAVFAQAIVDDGESGHGSPEREGTDVLAGLSYGYEGRKWYRWASIRHRSNRDGTEGVKRPDKWLFDLAAGIRPTPTEYLDPDWVWMLELNYERTERIHRPSGAMTGGSEWFLSPGLMWTLRNVAIKAGVQIPIHDSVERDSVPSDYRLLLELEWHL